MKSRGLVFILVVSWMMIACGDSSGDGGSRGSGFLSDEFTLISPVLDAQAQSDSQIQLSWSSVENDMEIIVVLQKQEGEGFTDMATLNLGAPFYIDSDLMEETTYTYRLRVEAAENEQIEPRYSQSVSATTLESGVDPQEDPIGVDDN